MSKSYPITGIPVLPGEPIPARRELSSWSISTTREDQIQVSLYIRALRQLEEKDPLNDELSFYRIAGIHGLPKVPWDNEGDGSYCPHNAFSFPTWHRPYMLLYEQCLYNIMINDIIPKNIQEKATRDEWMKAAQRWRLPFWEWALPQVDTKDFGVPNIVNDSKVEILKLDGQGKEPVANPLTQYYNKLNKAGVPMGDQKMGKFAIKFEGAKQFNRCIGTSRYGDPNKATWVNGVQNNSSITTALKNPDWGPDRPKKSIAENVFRILTSDYFQSYGPFSTTRYYTGSSPRPTEWLSLEQIHNNIHDWAGGEGHMAYVPVASFDPIFWLHHSNVDRLLAIWQYLNPDKWFDNTWGEDHTKPFDPSSPLLPFHRDTEKKLYSSNDTRDWKALGYTYPELLETNVNQLKKTLSEKYGRGITQLKVETVDGRHLPKGIDVHCFQDYVINVEYDRYALNGEPYKVVFHVKAEDRPGKIGETHHLGSFFNFVAPGLPDCSNCAAQQQSGVKSKAQVPITLPLHGLVTDPGYPDAENLEQEHVEVLLESQLRWTVSKLSGEEVPLTEVPGLLVTVYGGESGYPTDESLAAFKPDTYKPLWGATDGKQCGATRAAA